MLPEALINQIARILSVLEEKWGKSAAPDFTKIAFRWKKNGGLEGIARVAAIRLDDLKHIDTQKEKLVLNTRQFIAGLPANNALLTGARGSGKSSLMRAILQEFASQGLRMIEVDKSDLGDLPEIVALVENRPERFIIFCDDLSFEANDASYKALKSLLDGSIFQPPENILIYATSNRRHLMPDFFSENEETDEIHPFERTEEKISLSDRFGLWLSFYPFDQNEFLAIVRHWLKFFNVPESEFKNAEREALQWALSRGARSGRVAQQFARHYTGSRAFKKAKNPR